MLQAEAYYWWCTTILALQCMQKDGTLCTVLISWHKPLDRTHSDSGKDLEDISLRCWNRRILETWYVLILAKKPPLVKDLGEVFVSSDEINVDMHQLLLTRYDPSKSQRCQYSTDRTAWWHQCQIYPYCVIEGHHHIRTCLDPKIRNWVRYRDFSSGLLPVTLWQLFGRANSCAVPREATNQGRCPKAVYSDVAWTV